MTITAKMKLEVAPQPSGCDYTEQVRVANSFNKGNFPKQLIVQSKETTHRKIGCGTKYNGKIKYYCGNCAKELGKGSRQKLSLWCNICGWVHFNSSGLKRVDDYKKTLEFLCSKCAVTRKLIDSTAESLAYSKLHNVYTSCNNPVAFAGRNALKKRQNAARDTLKFF